jgi:hypothetical protein
VRTADLNEPQTLRTAATGDHLVKVRIFIVSLISSSQFSDEKVPASQVKDTT